MKTNLTIENDTPLRNVLREWHVDATLPPRFQEQVWQRIAREEAQTAPSLRQILSRWRKTVEAAFSRPALAVSYVAVLLMAGLTTGYLQAQDKATHAEAQWRALYVQSIDPYQAPGN